MTLIEAMTWQEGQMIVYKDKSETPEYVIDLIDDDIRTDQKKHNKFIINSSSHKNGSYEFKGTDMRDRNAW